MSGQTDTRRWEGVPRGFPKQTGVPLPDAADSQHSPANSSHSSRRERPYRDASESESDDDDGGSKVAQPEDGDGQETAWSTRRVQLQGMDPQGPWARYDESYGHDSEDAVSDTSSRPASPVTDIPIHASRSTRGSITEIHAAPHSHTSTSNRSGVSRHASTDHPPPPNPYGQALESDRGLMAYHPTHHMDHPNPFQPLSHGDASGRASQVTVSVDPASGPVDIKLKFNRDRPGSNYSARAYRGW